MESMQWTNAAQWVDWMSNPEAWLALLTLTVLEIVLGIDNIIFISILTQRLPTEQQPRARTLGLAGAMLTRIALLLSLAWLTRLTGPLFVVLGEEVSARDLILIGGGLFLLAKSTREIHHKIEGAGDEPRTGRTASFLSVLAQVAILDVVFSLDSVITAIGMARDVPVMVIAIVVAVLFMMLFAKWVSAFIDRHPTVKVLALSFLLLIGVALIADGLDLHIPKGYLYFSMAFSMFVETINLRLRARHTDPSS
jgi:predicted tellurium resistance membrane protein TerC